MHAAGQSFGNGSVEFLDLLRIILGLVVTNILALAFLLSDGWQGGINLCIFCFVMMLGSCLSCGMLKSTWIQNLFILDGHLISILAPALLLNVDVGVFQQGVVTLSWVGAGCLDLGADYFIHLLQGLANLFFDSLSH